MLQIPLWSYHSFQLEHMGKNVFSEIQNINYLFFTVNVVSMVCVVRNHQLTITKQIGEEKVKVKKN